MPNEKRSAVKRRGREAPVFARILSELMTQKLMTVREAAKIAGVSHSTLVNWRSGARPHHFPGVKLLAKALGVSFSFILTGEDDTRPTGEISITEIFEHGAPFFDGYAQVTIRPLIHKTKKEIPK